MASIVFTFNDTSGSASATYDMSQADMDRIVNAHRVIHSNDDGTPSNKNTARKQMARVAVKGWKDATRAYEQDQLASQVTDIPVTET